MCLPVCVKLKTKSIQIYFYCTQQYSDYPYQVHAILSSFWPCCVISSADFVTDVSFCFFTIWPPPFPSENLGKGKLIILETNGTNPGMLTIRSVYMFVP